MGVGIKGAQFRWPNRTIPYVIDADLGCDDEAAAAIEHWNTKSSIRFVKHTTEADYVRVQRLPGYAISDVGRRGGAQKVALGDSCSAGIIIHELGHTVGFWHEHCRDDRDQWVAVDWGNVKYGCEDNFKQGSIAGIPTPTEDIGPYDYGSIMHYPPDCFAMDKRDPTLLTLKPIPPGVTVGQRDGLSAGDIEAVEIMYQGIDMPAGG